MAVFTISNILITVFAFIGGLAAMGYYSMVEKSKLKEENIELKANLKAKDAAWEEATKVLDQRFQATAQNALNASQEQFMNLAQERFKNLQSDGAHDLEKRQKAIKDMVDPVQEKLKSLSSVVEQIKGTDEALRNDLRNLSKETSRLVGALRDPSAQGVWGEYILERLLEKSGLIKGVHYQTQVSIDAANSKRPDAVIKMQDGFNIIIDAKAPLNESIQRLSENISDSEHEQLIANVSRQVKEHVKALGRKNYWESVDSPDFTVLFLPSEHIYSMALRADPEIVNFAASQNIIIASPTLLMSLLRVVGMSWRQVELAQNAQEISALGVDLYKRFLKFTDHFEKVGKSLNTAMTGYNAAIGSMERQVLPAARKFRELQSAKAGLEPLPETRILENQPRAISMTMEDESEKKRA
ncbi:MAG: DNA recombination protein RmuC [Alphaproteobacteria bacterium]|nr:DNA recombination protein RmuC [Alphaproteobacteria bacterium]